MAESSFSSDLKVTFSEQTYRYGERSTASVIIRNPHKVPAKIFSLTAVAPNVEHFVNGSERKDDQENKAKIPLANDALVSTSVSVFGMSVSAETPKRTLNIQAAPNSRVEVPYSSGRFHRVNVEAMEGSVVEFVEPPEVATDPAQQNEPITVIPPGSEKIVSFDFKEANWLISPPKRQNFTVEIAFQIDGKEHSQVEISQYELVPPLQSLLLGGAFGAVLGSIARDLTSGIFDANLVAFRALTALVLSILATMILRRKDSGQSFITVEDFSGAFLIGALVGYQGPEYFSTIIEGVDPGQDDGG